MRLSKSNLLIAATALLMTSAPTHAQAPRTPPGKTYAPAHLADGQPQIRNGVWNRRAVGGLDNVRPEAKDHCAPNPPNPHP